MSQSSHTYAEMRTENGWELITQPIFPLLDVDGVGNTNEPFYWYRKELFAYLTEKSRVFGRFPEDVSKALLNQHSAEEQDYETPLMPFCTWIEDLEEVEVLGTMYQEHFKILKSLGETRIYIWFS